MHVKKIVKEVYDDMDWTLVSMLVLVIIFYFFVHDLLGGTLVRHNMWDSYTLQAYRWLQGKVGLGQNYEYLELAVYKNDWYVSFPPVPSVCMLPWVMLYGLSTPNNMIMIIYVLLTMTLVYDCACHFQYSNKAAAFWSVFIVLGSNVAWMSSMGGVWFQAQILNMLFCMAALDSILEKKRVAAYAFLALAVGCRPFSAIYYIPMFIYFYKFDKKTLDENISEKANIETESIKENNTSIENKDTQEIKAESIKTDETKAENIEKINTDDVKTEKIEITKNVFSNFISIAKKQVKALIIPALIAFAYMAYNYVRFDNPFEFGHNYLPEFTESQYGQFNITYLWTNLSNLFLRGIGMNADAQLELEEFDGFLMYIANPIFIILFVYFLRNIIKKKTDMLKASIVIAMFLNIIFLCIHKTLGGWQFGARYTVDLIPFALLYILLSKENKKLYRWEIFIGIFAIMFNIYGIFKCKSEMILDISQVIGI